MVAPDSFPAAPSGPPAAAEAPAAGEAAGRQRPRKRFLLIRHGQTTYNVEGRLPGWLPGVALTEEGLRQAHRAAVALAAVPPTAVISSPLERARDTAEVIARGWGLPVRLDDRLMDTDLPRWAGQKLAELDKSDPAWKAFVRHPDAPPEGVEGLDEVMRRAVAVVEDARQAEETGDNIVLVTHADVVKLIVAHYLGVSVDCVRYLHVDNASVTSLGFDGDQPPVLLALNWTPAPGWLATPVPQPSGEPRQEPGGVSADAAERRPREDEAAAPDPRASGSEASDV